LAHIDGALELTNTHIQSLQRTGDSFLMDKACRSGLFTPAELKRLNYCRLYLNALTLSDVTDAKGNRFAPGILDGTRSVQQSSSKGPSAKQERPSEVTWALWRRLLHTFGTKTQLFLPLGPWLSSGPELRRDWPTLFSPEFQKIYRRTGRQYDVCSQVRYCVYSFTPDETQADVPDDAIPTDASEVSDGWRVLPPSPTLYPEESIHFPATFQDYVDLLPDYDAMLIQRVDFLELDVYETYESLLSSDSLILVSDGGADDSRGSTGWIVSDDKGRRLLRGSGTVPGLDPRSYRAEGYAMVSGLTVLKHICLFCGHINMLPLKKLYCDNLGLVKKVSYFFKYRLAKVKCVLHSEYDVVNQIFHLLQEYTITPAITHVKGHQDSQIPYSSLPLPAQLNVDADGLATKELRDRPNLIHHVPFFPESKVQLLLSGTSVTRNISGAIRRHQGYRTLVPYMLERFGWTVDVTASVDWGGFAAAYKSSFQHRKFIFKFCMSLLPTGKTLHRRESRFDDRCPACSSPQESNDHLFQCQDISRQRWRSATTSDIRKRLETNSTNPVLVDIMMAGLDSYFHSKPLDYSEFTEFDHPFHPRRPYYSLMRHQDAIGWSHFLRGKLSHHWTLLQQDFVWRTNPSMSFDREAWLRLIIPPIFTACHDLWTTRNEERHGKDDKTKKSLHAAQVERDLRALYAVRAEVLAADHDLFRDTVEEHLTDEIYTIRQWVRSHKTTIQQSRRESRRRSTINIKLLPAYFHPLKKGKRKRTHLRSAPTPIPIYQSTRMGDHFQHAPSIPTPAPRSNKQLAHIVRNFQQLPLIFGGDHPT
jgi:hypothetical protein